MNIKCPLCGDKIDKGMTFFDHWCDLHDGDEVARYCNKLLEKIHEKIESLQKENEEYEQELHDGATILTNDIEIQVLKSLLEDEK